MTATTPRDRLLEAVVESALTEGIADKSLRAIAAAAGTSHRMLIHHFGSKQGLLVEVIRAVEARQRALFAEWNADPHGPLAELGRAFWSHLRDPGLAPQERLFFEVYGQALQGRDWARPLLPGVVDGWVGPLAATFTAAGESPATARIDARLAIAVTRGLLLDVLATGNAAETDEAMERFLQILTCQMKDSPPAPPSCAPDQTSDSH
jgi:AcrR family transcriptional regulator